MTLLKDDFDLNGFPWTFFATSHGKGAVDGIGAVVKRHVWNLVRSKRASVRNAETFADTCKNLKTIVKYVPSGEIDMKQSELDAAWKDIETVKGTQKVHHIIANAPYSITWKIFPQHDDEVEVLMRPEPNELLQSASTSETEKSQCAQSKISAMDVPAVGLWVAVIYDDMWVPGVIEKINLKGKVKVKYMKVIGPNRFVWPEKTDTEVIDFESVLSAIKCPLELVSNSHGRIYSLNGEEFTKILNHFMNLS